MIFDFLFKKKYGTGVLIDVRPEEEKEKDYKFGEIVVRADPVHWEEKSQYRRFPIFDQGQSSSCVAMTAAKVLGIMHQIHEGEWIDFSPGFIFQQRPNRPGYGMAGVDAWDIVRNNGALLEDFFPSQRKTDSQLDSYQVKNYEKDIAKVFKIDNPPIILPIKDIDTIASVIQKTGKGVMIFLYFTYNEWNRVVPEIQNNSLNLYSTTTLKHSVCAVDFTLYRNKKALAVDESWGLNSGVNGQRIITEDFFKSRNFFCAYPMNFKFSEGETPKPQYQFNNNLAFGQINVEVINLQDALKWFGFFPLNIQSTGNYYSVTSKAVLNWQKKFEVAGLAELEQLQGRYFGNKSKAKMNELLK